MAIGIWVVLNMADLFITLALTQLGLSFPNLEGTEFRQYGFYELNPIIRALPYPEGYIGYKVLITIIMIPIFYLISTKYKTLPMRLNIMFIITWIGGIVLYTVGRLVL